MKFKKVFILPFLLCSILFTSCEKDQALTPNSSFTGSIDPSISGSTNSILGSWNMVAMNYTGTSTNAGLSTSFTGVGKDFAYRLVITSNPDVYTMSGSYTVELATTFMGQTTTSDIPTANATNGTWIKTGNTLTLIESNGNTSNLPIISLGANNLSLDYAGLAGNVGPGAFNISSGQMDFVK